MIMTIQNFISEKEVAFWKHYTQFATMNPSSEVTLKTVVNGKESLDKVDRRYYSINSHFPIMHEVKQIAEENWKQPLKYSSSYAQIMDYYNKSEGLKWHAEGGISTVSVSINLSQAHEYGGAEFQIKDAKIDLPYRAAIFYDSTITHRVTPLDWGRKLSMVMWFPGKDQEVRDFSWRAQ